MHLTAFAAKARTSRQSSPVGRQDSVLEPSRMVKRVRNREFILQHTLLNTKRKTRYANLDLLLHVALHFPIQAMWQNTQKQTFFVDFCLEYETRSDKLRKTRRKTSPDMLQVARGPPGGASRAEIWGGGSGSMLPQKILMIVGVLRPILVHSEAYREAHRAL